MKYANSLGRSFDSPDIVIRILAREGSNRQTHSERLLSPEEVLSSVLDAYYPGGQTIEEALVIDAPTRRTPKPSPRHPVYLHHQSEPGEHGDYFPLMPANPGAPTPPTHPSSSGQANPPSISVLTTGVVPPLPSPGSRGSRHHRRPPLTRHTTDSPTMLGQGPGVTGMSTSISCSEAVSLTIRRKWRLSAFPTAPNCPNAEFAYTSGAGARRVPSNQVTFTFTASTSHIPANVAKAKGRGVA